MEKRKEMSLSQKHESNARIRMVRIEELHDFPEHPFKVEKNAQMLELMQSVRKEGVLVPVLVRDNPEGGGYQIISGHRRRMAAEWAGLTEVPVMVRNLTDEQAVIAMVDSNLHREKLLPSEKAFSYKMKLEAMKCQGKRHDLTSDQVEPKWEDIFAEVYPLESIYDESGRWTIQKKAGNKKNPLRSNELLAKQVGESVAQIKRYIRLNSLVPPILEMVDGERIALTSAVEISYLTEEEQYELYAVMDLEQSIPNLSQTNRIKRMSQNGTLDIDAMYSIMGETKPNQREKLMISAERIRQYFPRNYTPAQQIQIIEQLLKQWHTEQRKLRRKTNETR